MKVLAADTIIGNTTSLNKIPSIHLSDKDMAFVKDDKFTYFYRLYANSGLPENIPNVVVPSDAGISPKRWLLNGLYVNVLISTDIKTSTLSGVTSGGSNAINVIDQLNANNGLIVNGNTTFNAPASSAPFNVSNSKMIPNLNTNFLNGYTSDDFLSNNTIVVDIPNGVDEHTFNFYETKENINYSIALEMFNFIDANPSIYSWIVIDKTIYGFTVKFSGIIDSSNYKISYTIL
jgi:hypothetical protein